MLDCKELKVPRSKVSFSADFEREGAGGQSQMQGKAGTIDKEPEKA